jgi:hypothetical protein
MGHGYAFTIVPKHLGLFAWVAEFSSGLREERVDPAVALHRECCIGNEEARDKASKGSWSSALKHCVRSVGRMSAGRKVRLPAGMQRVSLDHGAS